MEAALGQLRASIARAEFPLTTATSAAATRDRSRLLDQIDDYLLPRYADVDAPLLAVVGGSTGAGKSTLVNSLIGAPVSASGALRPTTRSPVLIHHPQDREWFAGNRVLPTLVRTHGEGTTAQPGSEDVAPGRAALRMVTSEALPAGLALLDAPDLDSVVEQNRELAHQLLAAADLWLFVTTAHRYADAVPWELLNLAAERNVVIAVVLDRIPPRVRQEVHTDLTRMLRANGLAEATLFDIPESDLTSQGLLPAGAAQPVRDWLHGLSADAQARGEVVRRTLTGATGHALGQAETLIEALTDQDAAAQHLHTLATQAYRTDAVREALSDGAMLRGEVLARWQDLVGAGEFFQKLQSRIGRARDRVSAYVTRRPPPEQQVEVAITDGLHALLTAHADASAERARTAWARDGAGRDLVARALPGRASADFSERAAEQIRAWQRHLLELVGSEGAGKRTTARLLAFGVNGVGVALMVLVFASTGGLTGGEVAVAGGTAVVAQKVLEAVFGDDAVRRLTTAARTDVLARVEDLMAAEVARFTQLVPTDQPRDARARLTEAVAQVRARMDT
ncbi:dynamin family protein [Pseudactinotalea sp. Z1732]|uniref:dynamin family protein n=1 Tax=Micrococcales TaxID=85006 RepID=UPI003C7C790C